MCFEGVVHVNVEHQYTVDLNVIEFRDCHVDDHFPLEWDCDVVALLWQDITGPVFGVAPESYGIFPGAIAVVLRTVISASDTVDVDPLVDGFVSATYAHKQVSFCRVVEILTICAVCW